MILQIEPRFEGLLTAIHDYRQSVDHLTEIIESSQQLLLFDEIIVVQTDPEKASSALSTIRQLGGSSLLQAIATVYLSVAPERHLLIFRILRQAEKTGIHTLDLLTDDVFRFNGIFKKVRRETHAYKGLLRFQELKDHMLYAPFEPVANQLPIIGPHFMKRLSNENFLIHDVNRKTAFYYYDRIPEMIEIEKTALQLDENERTTTMRWAVFYDALGISERKNHKRRQSNMPKKYWTYLPELAPREYSD